MRRIAYSKYLRVFLVCVLSVLPVLAPRLSLASAGELTITPAVVDEKAKARDILKESITLVNTSDRKLILYPSVNNIDTQDGEQGFSAAINGDNNTRSLANWIELSRGVIELGPGEERTIPFVIRVNLSAIPGAYHATLAFADGNTRAEAEARGPLATATVNVEVQADIKEVMQLNRFTTDNVVFSGDDVLFTYQLQNIGNQELQPKGEIRIYNRRGEEVASVDVNADGKVISPDQTSQLASAWSAVSGFGKYKALLNVDYGKNQMASVQDSVYFWVIPWKQLLALFITTLVIVIFFALYFHRWLEERHLSKLALAGLLKIEDMAHIPHAPVPAYAAPVPPPPPPVESHSGEASTPRRSIFSFFSFRRSASASSAVIVDEPRAYAPAPAPEPARPRVQEIVLEHKAPKVAEDDFRFRPTSQARTASASIDLRRMCDPVAKEVPTEAHVINLKKR